MISNTLLDRYSLVSDQVERIELQIILSELERVLMRNSAGAVVEFGCYIGTTSLFIQRLLDHYNSDHEFHVYDSFQGLPEKSQFDQSPAGTQFIAGALSASKKDFIRQFTRQGLKPPVIHKAWFSALGADEVPDNILFAFLDGDYYDSIMDPLKLIAPKMAHGSTIVIDDYANDALPGAQRAADQWATRHGQTIRAQRSLGIIHLK